MTRIVLQGIGSQKIGSLAFRDSWAFVHHFKTSIDYNFEEVIFLLLRRMIRSSLCFVWFEENEWAEQPPPPISPLADAVPQIDLWPSAFVIDPFLSLCI